MTSVRGSTTIIALNESSLLVFLLALSAAAPLAIAANAPPVIKTPIADQTLFAGVTAKIDLTNAFNDPDTNAVRFSTVQGNFDVQLFRGQKPITVANFLKYVDQGPLFQNRSDDASSRVSFPSSYDSEFRRSRRRLYRHGRIDPTIADYRLRWRLFLRFKTSPAFRTNAAQSQWRNLAE